MNEEHLHLFIHEEIYQLPEDKPYTNGPLSTTSPPATLEDAEKNNLETNAEKTALEPKETTIESPEIPQSNYLDKPKKIPFAIFHSSREPQEIDLLSKIIAACQLAEGDFKIFSEGFDQSVMFTKALVFVPEATSFYSPIPYKESTFLCARPLSDLIHNTNEKAKLWDAMKRFILQ